MVERCALSGSDLKIKFRTILLTFITTPAITELTTIFRELTGPKPAIIRVGEEDKRPCVCPTAYTADDGANRSSRGNLQRGAILHLHRGRRDRNPDYVR